MADSSGEKLHNELEKLEEEIQGKLSGLFINSARELFEKHPTLESFGWAHITSQGGSYEKKFGLYSTRNNPRVNGKDGIHWQSSHGFDISAFLAAFKNEILLMAFGNDCRITINRDLTYQIEYDHQ